MGKNTSITLGEHFEAFVSEQLRRGRYASASEVVRAGLRLLEDEETRLAAINRLLEEGESSGWAEYELDAFIDGLDRDSG